MVYISKIVAGDDIWEITASETGVTGVTLQNSFVQAKENCWSRQGAEELLGYFKGERTSFSVPLDLEGTDFQKQVWSTLGEIPFGESRTYSQIAERIGKPSAVRAVANAIGRNPCLILVPCHRVLGKDGSLTGFSAGLSVKKQLLKLEKIPFRKEKQRT